MDLTLTLGERVAVKGATLTVTVKDVLWVPSVRDRLIELARRGETTTYGDLKANIGLPHAVHGLGRLLDLVAEDCARRGEPDLAALVVTKASAEVGSDYGGDPVAARDRLLRHWAAPQPI